MTSTKYRCYGGIAYAPWMEQSDMHGLVRVVVRARSKHAARVLCRSYGVTQVQHLEETKSAVEREVTIWVEDTPVVSALPLAYLQTKYYAPLRTRDWGEANKKRRGQWTPRP